MVLRLLVNNYNFQSVQVGHNEVLNAFMHKDDGFYGHENITPNANHIIN